MANIKDIARHLGVSVSTVSRAINNHPDIREETKLQVMEAIRSLNYRPNAIAKGLIQKKTYTIGLMIPEISDPFFSGLANAVEEMLFDHGYQVVYGNTNRNPDKEKQFICNAIERQFDGLIITPDFLDEEFIQLLSSLDMPVVFLRRRTPAALSIPFVDVDHYQAAVTAVNYLIELGHKQIGFISMPESSFTGNERLRGYKDTMQKHGLSSDHSRIVIGGRTIVHGREAMGKLYEKNPEVTAVFAANDLLGIGALEWLAVHELQVPDKLSVIGFDNLEYSELYWIRLTTMEQPRDEMGKRAAQLLLEMISNKETTLKSELISAKLIVRQSCKPVQTPTPSTE
ncbi:LacI family DNA-binding transcriptional regulator [Paenibacillus frigoriresistens]|uniref:LacI family DNA-binding transcriptional regulator n=1 Tax=Paenibacillus alginolyticus TaxID=59839 RepID=UPI00156655AD|nr:LacI family DNA-binding transcriptional regulator [Paenibacillus frigoriresistens]NRF92870.1 LacI family DNA-binding transcriptional regulator [Paenibacillus frigoriresistens]